MKNVRTGEFYGPFDLLLDLIEKSKMDIYDIRISEITNSYIKEINSMKIPSDEITDFIVIAASLLIIKAKSLVKDSIEFEEDQEDEISKDELVRRLVEYKKIKKIVIELRKFEKEGLKKHSKLQEDLNKYREEEIDDEIVYDVDLLKLSLESLIVKSTHEFEFKVDKILNVEEYSLEDYNRKIQNKLLEKKLLNISSIIKRAKNKSEVIVIFLSILELSKTKKLYILQDRDTLEIKVKLNEEEADER